MFYSMYLFTDVQRANRKASAVDGSNSGRISTIRLGLSQWVEPQSHGSGGECSGHCDVFGEQNV